MRSATWACPVILLLLVSGPFMISTSSSGEITPVDISGDDPAGNGSRSGSGTGDIKYSQPEVVDYFNGIHQVRYLYHPNGYVYGIFPDYEGSDHIDGSDDYIMVTIDGENLTEGNEVYVRLNVFKNQRYDFIPHVEAGPNGDIFLFLYSNIDLGSWGAGVLRFEMGEGPYPVDHEVLMDREINGMPGDISFHFLDDGALLSFTNESRLRVIDLYPEDGSVSDDGEIDLVLDLPLAGDSNRPMDMGCMENMLWIVEQRKRGEVWISWYDASLHPIGESLLLTLPPPVGMDNLIRGAVMGDRLYLFLYIDRISPDVYVSLMKVIISSDGSILKKEEDRSGGNGRARGSFPIISGSSVCLVTIRDNVLGMERYDPDLVFVEFVNLSKIYWLLYPIIDVRVYRGYQEVIVIALDLDWIIVSLGLSGYHPETIPRYGTMFVDDRFTMDGGKLDIAGGLYIEGTGEVSLTDVNISGMQIMNYGNLVVNGCSADTGRVEIQNFNDLSILDPPANMSVISTGELLCSGSRFSGWGKPSFEINGGNATFEGLFFIGEGIQDHPNPWIYGRNSRGGGLSSLTLTNCTFRDIDTILEGDDIPFFIDSCRFENIETVSDDGGVRLIRNSHFSNVSNINLLSRGEVRIENSTFVKSRGIFGYRSLPDKLQITIDDCAFSECAGILSRLNAYSRPRDVHFTMSGCVINRSDYVYVPQNIYVTIDGCLFEGGDRGIIIEASDGSIRIVNNTFRGMNVSVAILDSPSDFDPEYFIISYNTFLDDNVSIRYLGYHNEIYSAYHLGNDEQSLRIVDLFIDCRYNRWDSRSPSWVAGKISEGCYFLPFYDLEGRIVETGDMDLDLMNDDWERANDLDPEFYYDRFLDQDMDRYSNYEEYRSGTDPNDQDSNPADRLRVLFVVLFVILIFLPLLILMITGVWAYPEWRRRKRLKFYNYYTEYSGMRKDYEKKAKELELRKSVNDLKELLARDQRHKEPKNADDPRPEEGVDRG
ncbi:MAG: right-handed parallel beta-helix repeat-containing protein [Thermoplasmatota archaeon]